MENILTGHKSAKWKVYCQISEDNYIMYRYEDGNVRYAPLYITKFRLISPRKIMEAQRINKQFSCYEDIETIPDRMRWCRHQKGLMQIEVADLIGVPRKSYINIENGNLIRYEKKIVDKLAELYQIPVKDLLDDYSYFLYCGQGKVLRDYREKNNLERNELANMVGARTHHITMWEEEEIEISKKVWERCFKDILK